MCQYFIILKFKIKIVPDHIYIYIKGKVKVSNQTGCLNKLKKKKGPKQKRRTVSFAIAY